jgi:hypothetical protein
MPQIFRRGANTFARVSIFGAVVILGLIVVILVLIVRTPLITGQGVRHQQPVPYSHATHAGQLGIDCRYCHTTVEISSFATVPSSQICMNCHTYVLADDPQLAPIRDSVKTGEPVKWTRVNSLGDFAYFDHSAHINKGVGCVTCHGRIDQMVVTYQARTLFMEFCLGCHRHPEKHVRPVELVTNMSWQPKDQATQGRELVKEYGIESKTGCSTCHR